MEYGEAKKTGDSQVSENYSESEFRMIGAELGPLKDVECPPDRENHLKLYG